MNLNFLRRKNMTLEKKLRFEGKNWAFFEYLDFSSYNFLRRKPGRNVKVSP
jgi:hypothetical protein